MDSIISASTPVAAVIYLTLHISLEAWLGAFISIMIIKSGFEMLNETLSKILGERADIELARDIKKTVGSFSEVKGVYDLIMHNYGPDSYNGSVHIEVEDTLSADELDRLIREITVEVYQKHNVIMTAIGVYSLNTTDPKAVKARVEVSKLVMSEPYILQMHGFYIDYQKKEIRFDIVVSFDAPDRQKVYDAVVKKVGEEYPDFTLQVVMDTDFSET